ncbi:hypothetical protein Hypma_008276 [Hypsizygus marmoreus]|uniref:F-box domain-containing protein n=1 Tax=Hypsizygus marmoreus TaxID=39966 RepID=A0A369JTA6_HYPMA|nr:hypothetical protein Hypma_008276 [Hypsizygus marmoreus]
MPPYLRSQKALTRSELLTHQQALRAGPVNTTGLPALPTELLVEIVSYLPTIPVPATYAQNAAVFPGTCLERMRIMRALSQMCRSLRAVFLPLSWERIEACTIDRIDKMRRRPRAGLARSWERILATELVRQLEIVTIRDPSLASYVKIVNVILTTFSCETVVPELVRCLALFPNLHTVQFLGTSGPSRALDAFKGHTYPTVRTLVLPAFLSAIVRSFPRVTRIHSVWGPSQYVASQLCVGYCTDIEEWYGFEKIDYRLDILFDRKPVIDHLIEKLAKTRIMTLDTTNVSLSVDIINKLIKLPTLHQIELAIPFSKLEHIPPRVTMLIDAAKSVLRKPLSLNKQTMDRVLVLRFTDAVETVIARPLQPHTGSCATQLGALASS